MKVHFIGIGGVSMSALAAITQQNGHEVSGSDCSVKPKIEGIKFFAYHAPENVVGADLVVYTAAVKPDNIELIAAKKRAIRTMERAEFLALIEGGYYKSVAVSGTHGKTSTTAMLASLTDGINSSVHMGGNSLSLNGLNYRCGGGEVFITEACEYNRSFCRLNPFISIILNIEMDHPDCYKDIEDITSAFCDFAKKTRQGGAVICNSGDKNAVLAATTSGAKVITFGSSENCDYYAREITVEDGCFSYALMSKGKKLAQINLGVNGFYNVFNSMAAIACAIELGVKVADIERQIAAFLGVERRFQQKGSLNGAKIIVDYAHHPTEIREALNAAQLITKGRLIAVFQPHTYTRTHSLLDQFIKCFENADEICFIPTYAAREKVKNDMDARQIVAEIAKTHQATYFSSTRELVAYAKTTLKPHDTLILLGAGDIANLYKSLGL